MWDGIKPGYAVKRLPKLIDTVVFLVFWRATRSAILEVDESVGGYGSS